jgi:choline dehydrogenase-like flavoprotein
MFIDLRTLHNGAVMESDLCVIGAGAAGITIARELMGKSLQVCVVESGGLEFDANTQSLYEGESIGMPYYGLAQARLRFFGGTTNHWNGQCAPLSEIDFQERPWVQYSGWPISKADLDSYYQRALSICEIGNYVFDERQWKNLRIVPPPLNQAKVRSHFWQNSRGPTRFGTVYRDELKHSANIKVFLHANVTNINTNKTGVTVSDIEVAALNGKKARLKAKLFVLACGAMENARLLLVSNRVQTKGLGNRHDLVGRFFMDHPTAMCGTVEMADVDHLLDTYANRVFEGTRYRPGLAIGEEVQRHEKVLNAAATFETEENAPSAITAGKELFLALKQGRIPEDSGEKIRRVISDLDDAASYLFCRVRAKAKCTTTVPHLRTRVEQAPNPDSRLTLSQERDALGVPRLRLDWRLTELERRTVRSMAMTIGSEFGRLNIGRVKLPKWLVEDVSPEWIGGSFHHMGTTRMAVSPKLGVVNRDCRVHGIDNLYVAGSSVFPTSGFVNPTLTIVALALRLADHLRVA